jgi:tetratricopeptide (TPR) repeat protein
MPSLIQLISALALLTQAQAATPAADDAAVCERAAGADAIAACDRLISSGSAQGSALAGLYRNRCAAHIAARDADGALADCNEAVRLDPAAAAGYMARGDAFTSRREFARAIADYSEAIRLDPQHADAYVRRGRALRAHRDYEGAIADFGQALRLDPNNAVAFLDRGLAWLDQHEHDRAIMSELLKELRSPGISAEEVFTRIGVSRASEAEQVPWVASSLLDLVYFVHATADRRGRQ